MVEEIDKKYRVTAILDMRDQKESPDEIAKRIGTLMQTLGGEVLSSSALGQKEFARCAKPKFRSGFYLQYEVNVPANFDSTLRNRLHLDKVVNRVLMERI